jgi:hypothetical protein
MRAICIRADASEAKDRAKVQRCDTLAKNALFIEFVRRWEAGLAAGECTKDLKRRLDSLEARNTELDEARNNLSTRQGEQEAMFAEWELSYDQRQVDCKEEDQNSKKKLIDGHASHLKWVKENSDSLDKQLTQSQKMSRQSVRESKDNIEFAIACKEYQRNDAAHIDTLEGVLRRFLGNAGLLKAGPVAKKQKTEPRNPKGGWGGARRGPAYDAKRTSSGIAEQKGAKGEGAAPERINMHLRPLT